MVRGTMAERGWRMRLPAASDLRSTSPEPGCSDSSEPSLTSLAAAFALTAGAAPLLLLSCQQCPSTHPCLVECAAALIASLLQLHLTSSELLQAPPISEMSMTGTLRFHPPRN